MLPTCLLCRGFVPSGEVPITSRLSLDTTNTEDVTIAERSYNKEVFTTVRPLADQRRERL